MKHGSLFSGIGGFDLAAEWMGWDNLFHCEWNEFGQKVLKHYWPNAESFSDITKTDFKKYANKIDVLTGGFPCQPYSQAGKRLGKEDDRHLWPEMLRAIREIKPKYIVGENVSGIVNWSGGLVFEEVQTDLEAEGYEVQAVLLPACSKNAPHRRERVWFVAYCGSFRSNNWSNNRKERYFQNNVNGNASKDKPKRGEWECRACKTRKVGDVANAKSESSWRELQQRQREGEFRGCDCSINEYGNTSDFERIRSPREEHRKKESRFNPQANKGNGWENFPTQSPICSGDDGVSERLDGITFPKWRNESIKAYGNAIVPQVAYEIFKVIGKLNCP
jgi:DNA (cytosine-5)-methyltransferase 1